MQKNRILFYDSHHKNRRDALRILTATGCEVCAPESLLELKKRVEQTKFTIYVLDIEGHQHLLQHERSPGNRPTVIMSQEGLKEIYPYLEQLESFTNFIAKDRNNRLSNRDLLGTISKILRNDIFGMKKYLAWGAHTLTFHVRDSENRQEYIDCMKDYCRNMGLRRSIINDVEVVAEEFLMNAIYDAPIDKKRQKLFDHMPRTERILLTPDQAARLEFGSDGKRLAISVTDPFGSITRAKVMQYLKKCFEGKNITNLNSTGGAGLGLYFCFNHVDSLIINVDPLRKTEFVGIIDIDSSVKDSKRNHTNFHFFNTNNWARGFLLGSKDDSLSSVAS